MFIRVPCRRDLNIHRLDCGSLECCKAISFYGRICLRFGIRGNSSVVLRHKRNLADFIAFALALI